jgi:ELWxxDGT repeat protein
MKRFLFSTDNKNGPLGLYSTDGTAAGTTQLLLPSLTALGSPTEPNPDFTSFNGKTYFLGTGGNETRVYGTDGTVAGTGSVLVTGVGGIAAPRGLWTVNGHLLASGETTGTPAGLWSSTDGSNFTEIKTGVGTDNLTVSHGIGFFGGDLTGNGVEELWRTDGTAAGTQNITPQYSPINPGDFISVGNGLTVFANQYAGGASELWVTDGTAAGTLPVINGGLGTQLLSVYGGASTGSRAIFTAINGANEISVWATDGTSPGTVQLLVNGPAYGAIRRPNSYQTFGNKVLFDSGYGLYVTDGTAAGTVRLSASESLSYTVVGSNVFFVRFGPAIGSSLFVSDGTIAGTHQVPVPGLQPIQSTGPFATVGNSVVFEGTDVSGKTTLFTSDGTAAGTSELTLPVGVTPNLNTVIAPLPASTASGVVTLGGGAQDYVAAAGTTVQAGTGSDTISANAGQVTVLGNSGRIMFLGGSGPSSVSGATGSVTVFGGPGGGHYSGGTVGHNILVAQGGNTMLTGAAGGDQIFGAATGNDVLNFGAGREIVVGGGGNTTINGGADSSVIFTGAGTTSVVGGVGGGDTIVGGSGVLRVTAQHGDAIFGGSGALAVEGSAAGSHADSIIGGSGALTVVGHGANMLVVGSTTASNIFTGDGASLIFAGSGSTSVTGGAGSMQVVLGTGGGTFREGGGPSIYNVVKGSATGLDVITGFRSGTDAVALYGYVPGDVQVVRSGGSTMLNLAGGTKIELLGVADPGRSVIGA